MTYHRESQDSIVIRDIDGILAIKISGDTGLGTL